MAVVIKHCTCKHEAQDVMYGKGNRVMNECKEGKSIRCTVCGKEISETVKK